MESTERNRLEERHARERAELDAKLAVLAELPAPDDPRWTVYPGKLWGTVARATLRLDEFSYPEKRPAPTLADVRRIAEGLPPAVGLVDVRDGCRSFRPEPYVSALPEEGKTRWESETGCAPFVVRLDQMRYPGIASFGFTVPLSVGMVEVRVQVPIPAAGLGEIRTEWTHYERAGVSEVRSCAFLPSDAARQVSRDGDPLADLGMVKWASGGHPQRHPNEFTLYWIPLRDDIRPTVADLVDTLEG